MAAGHHALTAVEVPFLHEAPSDTTSATNWRRHVEATLQDIQRMLAGLHQPELWQNLPTGEPTAVPTFDLRLVSAPGCGGPGAVRIFLLSKAFVPAFDSGSSAVVRLTALNKSVRGAQLLRALAPKTLTLQDVAWQPAAAAAHQVAVSPRTVALSGDLGEFGCLRRRNLLVASQPQEDYKIFVRTQENQTCGILGLDPRAALPTAWPASLHDLQVTCGMLAAASSPAVVSVRLAPTVRTPGEYRALKRLQQQLRDASAASTVDSHAYALLQAVTALLQSTALFTASLEVAATTQAIMRGILTTLVSEQGSGVGPDTVGWPARGRPAQVTAVHDAERAVAEYNLTSVDFWPWGSVDRDAQEASRPSGSYVEGAPDLSPFQRPPEILSPEVFLQRDLERDPRLTRLRSLLSVGEASSLWRLPIVGTGGQAGLSSRPANPFEQLPPADGTGADLISLGLLQHRGVATEQHYAVPLTGHHRGQAGIGDRVSVVAGSPGSGKTNFCLHFLEQLWDEGAPSGRRVPYLVIDPTRGGEFRWLFNAAPEELVVFTVGDVRGVPFCFNPFIVPLNVSLQAHISKLMSCFRAAYHMWDPLPAIFEDAIRLAYRRKTEELGGAWVPTSTFGTGQASDYPDLNDVCAAMGLGEPDETGTVLAEQRRLWSADGQGTENQATIVASTSLRLKNLRDNYEHVIGGAASGRPCIDLNQLLKVPTVLELGMIGDSQALSLVMAFLVVCLVGCIENRDRAAYPLHMLVIEEAHRLLSAEGGVDREGSSSRAQAAEDLNTMLAEVRKYGQGVMLLDQRPGSLVGGAIDNAYLVALHRLNEHKSFEQFANMLNLNGEQRRFARVGLRPGESIVLDRPSAVPVVIRPPEKPKEQAAAELADEQMGRRTAARVKNMAYPDPSERRVQPDLDGILALCQSDDESLKKLERIRAHLADTTERDGPSVERLARDLASRLPSRKGSLAEAAEMLLSHLRPVSGPSTIETDEGLGRRW
ncbi:MAG: hypothetical protein ACR2MB_11750 [Acidimicrobiales bacterium]